MKLIALIPHYNHIGTVGQVVQTLKDMDIDCLIIDDGSDEIVKPVLQQLQTQNVMVIYRAINGGKGAAVKDGMKYASKHGYTHALQVDADAQHCLADTEKLIALACENPQAVICARPLYGDDAPKTRLYGRKISNFWMVINTLSFDIKDGMCGFRIYPLNLTIDIVRNEYLGNYMDFDIELLVKLHRYGAQFMWIDTPVTYAEEGISHFRAWHDNMLISWMHARLFAGMLFRAPKILWSKWQRGAHD